MSFVLEFLPEAAAELECATGDYEARRAGLGVRFRELIESTCSAIVQHPLLWRERAEGWRRINLPGFPYYIAFILRGERVLIAAVAHVSRHPDYWKSRMP
ncbi:MAG: type II toxin-antitoxin system RelE/ParE family toxin [Verrucomicrobiaceae bacterium]|nr:type II toxin-antitoxin system RelE/ParE family toxin [Verrucomicrobiaceae bacterium]